MKTQTIITWIIVLLVVILGGWYLYSMQSASPSIIPSGQTQTNEETASGDVSSTAPMSATIVHTSLGFSPASVTIAKGGTVTWTDEDGSPMWIASAMHPTHVVYDNTDLEKHCATGYTGTTPFDQCKSGTTYIFTFNEVGTWGYHNHSNASQFGKIIVK